MSKEKTRSLHARGGSSTDLPSPSERAHAAFIEFLEQNIGKRALFLTAEFPFLYIGEILEIIEDYVRVLVDTTEQPVFEDRRWIIHIDAIRVLYVETEGFPDIPELKD
ncbi:hypothetical protein JOC77_002490 [Peribacillus deserti]|uniref:DUF2642 domain-containing protein n=1 Tax=Peribacillus deserti TaxID=673318 RepID=A0ABS2QIS8_9BACI|nr:hypothetical protein [Peribacillus deserti]MBM7693051.1 hypothetical protein [Peribacillus deserti]